VSLIAKYNVPAPRYTSYPTVPYWDESTFTAGKWNDHFLTAFRKENVRNGISLYIHLPYCESLCTYCGCNKYITLNHKVEVPYIEAVHKEWAQYKRLMNEIPYIAEIHLGGGTPTFFSPENLQLLIKGLLSGAVLLPDAAMSFEAHPNNTTKAHLETLHKLGFSRLSLGIQDFDPKVQEIIHRIQPVETVQRVMREARFAGYLTINFDLIYGLPLQTVESMQKTVAEVIRLRPDRISFYSYAHVPWIKGTGQRRYTEADLPDENTKRILYEQGREAFEAAGYTEIGMDHFALKGDELYRAREKGNLHRNFMGYTVSHSKVLIGLGASSISDCWTAYAQNEKTVSAYLKAVNEDRLPVFRGHVLDEEDLVLRPLIHDLMCHFEADISAIKALPVIEAGLERLHDMEEDGLVEVHNNFIRVTETGRAFVRNICMAFDARLWRNMPQTQLFSKSV
jgi:oxygen-independent coproporphyrinogen III oxidase